MKNIIKHICCLFLVVFMLIAALGCSKVEVKFSLTVPDQIYVLEEVNVSYDINVENFEVVEVTSANNEVISCTNSVLKGISEGSSEITVVIIYENIEYKASKIVTVIKEKNYQLDVKVNSEIYVDEVVSIEVYEKTTNTLLESYYALSSNEEVFKIVAGKVQGVAVGSAELIVSAEFDGINLSQKVLINVIEKQANVLSINLPDKIYSGQLFEIEIKYIPDNAIVEEFTLESSNTDIFEYYDDDYEAQTYDCGEVILTCTAKYKGKEYTQEFVIEVLEALKIEIDLPNEISNKEPVSFKVYLNPGKIEITDFSASAANTKAFKVENGIVTPLEIGSGLIAISCVYDGAKFTYSHKLSIVRYYQEYIVSDIQELMFVDEFIGVNVAIQPNDEIVNDFEITSSNNEVIAVDGKVITALKEGNAKVTIKAKGLEKVYDIDVVTFENISIEISDEISEKQVVEYKVIATPSNKEIKMFKYEVSTPDVLVVNNNLIYGYKEGKSEITVSYLYKDKLYEATAEVEVSKIVYPIERIFVDASNAILLGTSCELNVKKYPSVGEGVISLSVNDSSLASLEGNVLTALKEGTVTVNAVVEGSNIKSSVEIKIIKKNELSELTNGVNQGNPMVARYYEDSIKLYNELMGGVIQTTYIGYTSTQLGGDEDGYSGLDGSIELDKYYQQQVNVLEIPSSKDIKVIPWANLNNNKWTLTTVRGLIENYELANPGYKVIAAVNGDFFDINAGKNLPYSTTGENISDGEFYKTSNIFGAGGGTIGFTNDGSNLTLIGGSHAVRNSYMTLAIYDEVGKIISEFKVEKINEEPLDNETSVYYGVYNENKEYVPIDSLSESTYVVGKAELALPNDTLDFYGKGVISSTEKTTLQIGQFAITTKNSDLKSALKIGTKIRVQFEFDENDKYANVTSATGYNGVIFEEDYTTIEYTDGNLLNRAPRTVIGMKADGTLVMMVVDGRQGANKMYGCDGYELAAIMKAYGCVKAYNVDGGGSSTMVIRTDSGLQVTNSPSDGRERSDGNCILICVADPSYTTNVTNVTSSSATVNVSTDILEFKDKELYINLDNQFHKVVNGKVELTSLVHNSEYSYRVYYKENDKYIATQSVGVIKTLQDNFRFLGLVIKETSNEFIINAYCDDVDKCSNVNEMTVTINDINIYLKNGTGSISKSKVGNKILMITSNYWYFDGGERISVIDENPVYFVIR